MKKKVLLLIILLFNFFISAQKKELSFPIYDDSFEYFTMKQADDLFMSIYELGTDLFVNNYSMDLDFKSSTLGEKISYGFKLFSLMTIDSFLVIPITHEEAHRAILTFNNIGSISQPIFKFKSFTVGIAYVKGVSDISLKSLRDNDFPSFIRLHTAGNESDYCIIQKDFSRIIFNHLYNAEFTQIHPIYLDLLLRNISMISYETSALSTGLSMKEESNELERDIVGDDICGMIHHLFNPTAEYHRYFSSEDFSIDEKKFAKRIALRTIVNFSSILPMLMKKPMIIFNDDIGLSFNIGYCLSPFGDFFDERFLIQVNSIKIQEPLDLVFIARQYQNKEKWFPEFIIQCERFSPFEWLTLSGSLDLWWQPQNLSFTTKESFIGGSIKLGCIFYPFKTVPDANYDFGINLGALYKTEGFMPEVMSLDEDFVFSIGIIIRY